MRGHGDWGDHVFCKVVQSASLSAAHQVSSHAKQHSCDKAWVYVGGLESLSTVLLSRHVDNAAVIACQPVEQLGQTAVLVPARFLTQTRAQTVTAVKLANLKVTGTFIVLHSCSNMKVLLDSPTSVAVWPAAPD